MTKFQIVSDLHLERVSYKNMTDYVIKSADYLILAGDIGNPLHPSLDLFLHDVAKSFKLVLYVLGNHEYYNYKRLSMNTIKNLIYDITKKYNNILLLDNNTYTIDNICIIGSTLWSHCPSDKVARNLIKSISDYQNIYREDKTLITPYYINSIHQQAVSFIKENIEYCQKENKIPIVVTHYLPTFECINKQYKDSIINYAFASNLDYMLSVKYWIHGHTHTKVNVCINGCNILANPHGYEGENKEIDKCFVLVL